MKRYYCMFLGLLNIVGCFFIEMAIMAGWIKDIHSFNILSVFGLLFALIHGFFLYQSIKNKEKSIIVFTILFALIYGVYQTISIAAIGYRYLLVVNGIVLVINDKKRE